MTCSVFVRPLCLLLTCLGLCLQAGCSLLPAPAADPTRYYVLNGKSSDASRAQKAEDAVVIGLKRVEIAPYLDCKDMVVREAGNEISYHSFSRWAEPLGTSIGQVLNNHLAASANVSRVYLQPFPLEVVRDYDLAVTISRCEGERLADGRIVASVVAIVELTEATEEGEVVLRKTIVVPVQNWDGKDFGVLAARLSASVDTLGDELVKLVGSL
jgi:uncharacterized protein